MITKWAKIWECPKKFLFFFLQIILIYFYTLSCKVGKNRDKSDMVFLLPQVAFLLKPQLIWMHFLLKEAIKTHYRGIFFKYHHAIWPSRNHLEVCPNSTRYLQENPMQWSYNRTSIAFYGLPKSLTFSNICPLVTMSKISLIICSWFVIMG